MSEYDILFSNCINMYIGSHFYEEDTLAIWLPILSSVKCLFTFFNFPIIISNFELFKSMLKIDGIAR